MKAKSKKKPTLTLIAELVVKSKHPEKLPEFKKGMGKGVLATKEFTFTDANGRGFDGPLFACAVGRAGMAFADELIEVRWRKKDAGKKAVSP